VHRVVRVILYLGTAAAVLGFGKLHAAAVGDYDFTSSSRFGWSIAYIGALALAAYAVGLPDQAPRSRRGLPAAAMATAAAAGAISVLQLLLGSALLPRFVVFSSGMLLVPFYALLGLLAAGGRERREERERVVVVAGETEALALMREISDAPEKPATVVWALRPAEADEFIEAVENTRATVVVLDRAAQNDERIISDVAELHARGVRVRTLSLFYDEWLGKLPLAELERLSLLFDIQELHSAVYARVKRLLDICVATAGLVALAAVTPVVALANLFGNRGPLLYRQARVGKGGRVFAMIKFRTMRPQGAEAPSTWTSEDDPRITPVGRWLRRTHVDELPQLINILRGDLSLVGPRPEQPGYVDDLTEKVPFYALRHIVRPGLTGWAQVKYAYGASAFDAMEKLQYEFFYLRHQGLALDARILARTIRHVVGRDGR
jgi:lipopolysaccharide/colanic/teichoic acid biosynthesis glycosyltransferase